MAKSWQIKQGDVIAQTEFDPADGCVYNLYRDCRVVVQTLKAKPGGNQKQERSIAKIDSPVCWVIRYPQHHFKVRQKQDVHGYLMSLHLIVRAWEFGDWYLLKLEAHFVSGDQKTYFLPLGRLHAGIADGSLPIIHQRDYEDQIPLRPEDPIWMANREAALQEGALYAKAGCPLVPAILKRMQEPDNQNSKQNKLFAE